MAAAIPSFKFKGVPKITIPKADTDFADVKKAIDVIKKYLPSVLQKHAANKAKIDYLHRFALGEQDITYKKRLYNKDTKNNNQITENHAYRQVNFKVAFITSERRDYAHKSDSHSNDMTYLERYLTDIDFFAKDKDVKEWIYQVGVGVTYECHRTDIIEQRKDKTFAYKTAEDGFDINTEAPFEFSVLDPRDNFVVYSSIRGNDPLFCVSVVEVEKSDGASLTGDDYEYRLYIETRYARYIAKCSTYFDNPDGVTLEVEKAFHSMPMIEHYSNSARMGVVELNRDLFNCVNTLVSNVVDMVVDGANMILVFKNTDIKQKTIDEMKQKGALVLNDNPDNPKGNEAKLETITLKIDFAGFNSFYEERLTQAYDIAGVPIASGQVTSGGDTGQARLLGSGWSNAVTIIKNDITTILKADYAVLRGFLAICKTVPDCPVNSISASQIDIKYHINQSDNLLAKAESITQLYGVNFPKEEILKATNLVSDICDVSTKWEESDAKAKAEAKAATQAASVPTNNQGGGTSETNNDNNSQE